MLDQTIIKDQPTAAVFASPRQRQIVQLLIAGEMSLGDLASATDMQLSLLHYHLSHCLRLGLVEIVREKRRAGRAVKYYRAAAKSFFVPAELIVEMPGTAMNLKLRELLDLALARSLEGLNFRHDGLRPRADLVADPDLQRGTVELWLDVGLTSTDAAELASELQAVADRFRVRADAASPRYLVHLAAVKL